MQKSYAARHLRNMRDSVSQSSLDLDSPDHAPFFSPDFQPSKLPWFADRVKEDSVCSIEVQRNVDSPPTMDLCISNPRMSLNLSPDANDSFSRKRTFDCVSKSPVPPRRSQSTGLTMEFERFQVHSCEQPMKRQNSQQDITPAKLPTQPTETPVLPTQPMDGQCTPSTPAEIPIPFQDQSAYRTPDQQYSIEPMVYDSPRTPPNAPNVSIPFSCMSSSPIPDQNSSKGQANPLRALPQRVTPFKIFHSGPGSSPMSADTDSSFNKSKENYLDISGTQAIPPTSPIAEGTDESSCLQSDHEEVSFSDTSNNSGHVSTLSNFEPETSHSQEDGESNKSSANGNLSNSHLDSSLLNLSTSAATNDNASNTTDPISESISTAPDDHPSNTTDPISESTSTAPDDNASSDSHESRGKETPIDNCGPEMIPLCQDDSNGYKDSESGQEKLCENADKTAGNEENMETQNEGENLPAAVHHDTVSGMKKQHGTSPKTSTPQVSENSASEQPLLDKFPAKKPVNKLLKKASFTFFVPVFGKGRFNKFNVSGKRNSIIIISRHPPAPL